MQSGEVEHALPTVLDTQDQSIGSLQASEREQLADLLRTVLEGLGDNPPFRPPFVVGKEVRCSSPVDPS